MLVWGDRLAGMMALVGVMAAGPVAAQGSGDGTVSAPVLAPVPVSVSVLVAPVQGSEGVRRVHGERLEGAVRRALEVRGYPVTATGGALGQAAIACQTPECVEQTLDAAGAAFAIVPAIWSRKSGGEELTLTLVQKSGRSLNANGVVGDDLSATAADLVDELLTRQAAAVAVAASEAEAPREAEAPPHPRGSASGGGHPHAWKAGPIILIAGGAAAVVAVGAAAGIRNDTQQLNSGAVAAWSAIGAAAIAGGITWWVIGDKRRQQKAESASTVTPSIAFHPTGIDLRLRF